MAVAHQPPDVPAALWRAIVRAGRKYNVPPLVLAAIWRGESASTYPNPYVNSQGYGGLFGTKDWNGSTQQQADYAASIFHNALVQTHGNIYEANGIYATGKPTPGLYGHAGLPSGTVGGYGGGASSVSLPKGSLPQNPDGTYGSKHRTAAQVKAFFEKFVNDIFTGKLTTQQANQKLANYIGVPVSEVNIHGAPLGGFPGGGAIESAAGAVAAPFKSAYDAIKWLFSINGLEVIGGGIIMLLGLYLLAKQVGLDPPGVPAPAKQAADKTDKGVSDIFKDPPGAEGEQARLDRELTAAFETGYGQGAKEAARREGRRQAIAETPRRENLSPKPVY